MDICPVVGSSSESASQLPASPHRSHGQGWASPTHPVFGGDRRDFSRWRRGVWVSQSRHLPAPAFEMLNKLARPCAAACAQQKIWTPWKKRSGCVPPVILLARMAKSDAHSRNVVADATVRQHCRLHYSHYQWLSFARGPDLAFDLSFKQR